MRCNLMQIAHSIYAQNNNNKNNAIRVQSKIITRSVFPNNGEMK